MRCLGFDKVPFEVLHGGILVVSCQVPPSSSQRRLCCIHIQWLSLYIANMVFQMCISSWRHHMPCKTVDECECDCHSIEDGDHESHLSRNLAQGTHESRWDKLTVGKSFITVGAKRYCRYRGRFAREMDRGHVPLLTDVASQDAFHNSYLSVREPRFLTSSPC